MWGIVPAAGAGSRIQPLAFSKELLPVGSRLDHGVERPRAVSEYLVERMLLGGADKLLFVISPGKSDIVEYYGNRVAHAHACYTVQPKARGLCDAMFRAVPFIGLDEDVVVGLPDTIWFPQDALCALTGDGLEFLLFPVDRPDLFDAVHFEIDGRVRAIEVKEPGVATPWIWGAFRMPASVLVRLYSLWNRRGRRDEYFGTLVNAYLEAGGQARAVPAGEAYVDVGTLHGYREAIRVLETREAERRLAAPGAGAVAP